ncbi:MULTISPECIES: mobilization protein MobS [Psychrobacter]|uniref:Mobilization protein MobS n=1 Tax=Psychrobacter pasteurii TaxID=1945520 RepID=A0A1R4EJ29_9GAMM|nr:MULTISPECIES: mobilization protein MobS [Psychrobacter]SJM38492.1 hypothetical protein A1019T_02489 [Psychrobacter pasteurii]
MSLLGGNDLKEQQRINELEAKINREKQKLDKKLTRQKILLGAFFVDALENNSVQGLKEYTADNLLDFLSRQGDKDLMTDLVKGLGGTVETKSDNKNDLELNASLDEHL